MPVVPVPSEPATATESEPTEETQASVRWCPLRAVAAATAETISRPATTVRMAVAAVVLVAVERVSAEQAVEPEYLVVTAALGAHLATQPIGKAAAVVVPVVTAATPPISEPAWAATVAPRE